MDALQSSIAQWLGSVASLLPLGYAFGAGMLSTANPCGFAMLPAYLGLYLGTRGDGTNVVSGSGGIAVAAVSVPAQLARALVITLAVTGGFVVLFGSFGVAFSLGGRALVSAIPWAAVAVGAVLVVLGIAMLRGLHLSAGIAARWSARLGDPKNVGIRGFFVFGLAYGLASLSCTLPIFLTVVASSLTASGFAAATGQFVTYALGMGLVILVLTLGIGIFKGAMVSTVRRVVPYVEKASALLMILAGGYVVYYWLFGKGQLIAGL